MPGVSWRSRLVSQERHAKGGATCRHESRRLTLVEYSPAALASATNPSTAPSSAVSARPTRSQCRLASVKLAGKKYLS